MIKIIVTVVVVYLVIGLLIGIKNCLRLARTSDTLLKNIDYLTNTNLLHYWRSKETRKKVVLISILYHTFLWPKSIIDNIKFGIKIARIIYVETGYAEAFDIKNVDSLNDIDLEEEDRKFLEEK